jgi:hypothetical protein
VVVAGPADEVVGKVGADGAGVADVLDREVELLEGESADLADHARDDVVRRVRERVTLGPRRKALRALLHPEESVRVEAQRAGAQLAERVQASPMTSRIPANVGSSQLIDG